MEYVGYRLHIQFPPLEMRVSSRHDGIRSAPSCTMSRYMINLSRNRGRQAYSAEGVYQDHFKTQKFIGIEPTKILFAVKFINQVIFAVCVF